MPYANEERKQAVISLSSAATTEIVSAKGSGTRIVIDFITLLPSGGANTITLVGNISPSFTLTQYQPLTFENAMHDPMGVFMCNDNQAFSITTSAASLVTGYIKYRIINN